MNEQFTNPDHHLHLQIPELRNNMIKRSITPLPETYRRLISLYRKFNNKAIGKLIGGPYLSSHIRRIRFT